MLVALYAGVAAELATSTVFALPATAPPVDAGCGFALSVGALAPLLAEASDADTCWRNKVFCRLASLGQLESL